MSSDQYLNYFMAQSCIHIVINYLQPPETDQNMPLFVPLSLASTKFRKIPGKHRNSTETGKFRGSARISVIRGKLWSLLIIIPDIHLIVLSFSFTYSPLSTCWYQTYIFQVQARAVSKTVYGLVFGRCTLPPF